MPAKQGGLLGPQRCRLKNFKLLSRLGYLPVSDEGYILKSTFQELSDDMLHCSFRLAR
jgi:hypothetical protein